MPTNLMEIKTSKKECKVRGREDFYTFSRPPSLSNYPKN